VSEYLETKVVVVVVVIVHKECVFFGGKKLINLVAI